MLPAAYLDKEGRGESYCINIAEASLGSLQESAASPAVLLLGQPKANPAPPNSSGRTEPSAPGEQAAAAPGREDQRWRRAPGTAGREQAERAWSSRDGIKNTLARSVVALSENNPPKCVKMFIL